METLDRKTQPKAYSIDDIKFDNPKKITFDNNVPFYYFDNPEQEIIKLDFIFDAGTKYQEKPLVASVTNKMLKEGTKSFTSKQIDEKIDFYGAYLIPSTTKDNAVISLYCLNKNLKHLLPLVEEIIKFPVFDKTELNILLHKHKQGFLLDSQKVSVLAARNFSQALFGKNHQYAFNVKLDDYNNITQKQLFDFYTRHYTVNNLKIVAAGNINNEVKSLINNKFSDKWNINFTDDFIIYKPQTTKQKFNLIKKDDTVQAAMRIGKILFNRLHDDYQGMLVLNTIFGGYFGSRLMTNIREDKGYTYGISSSLVSLGDTGYLAISSEVGKNVCKNAINEVYNEIKILQNELVNKQELDLVKNYMLGQILRSFDGVFPTSDNFISLMINDLDFEYYNRLINKIKTIDSNEINKLAQKYLDKDSFIEVVAGDC